MRRRQRWLSTLLAALAFLAACGGSSNEPVFVGTNDVDEGDCINLPEIIDAVAAFEERSCDEGHDGQVLAVFDLDDADEFPGVDEVLAVSEAGCIDRFAEFIGVSYAESVFFLQTFTPTEESWSGDDDRSVLCVVVPGEGTGQLTRDLRGVAE